MSSYHWHFTWTCIDSNDITATIFITNLIYHPDKNDVVLERSNLPLRCLLSNCWIWNLPETGYRVVSGADDTVSLALHQLIIIILLRILLRWACYIRRNIQAEGEMLRWDGGSNSLARQRRSISLHGSFKRVDLRVQLCL